MSEKDIKTILDGCKAVKNKHFYKEAYLELEKVKTLVENEQLNDLIHTSAQCLYQDKEIDSKVRFQKALNLLDKSTNEQEKSRLKGAVYKRKYQLYKNQEDLQIAINSYEVAADHVEEDRGYGAVNTIYLYLELINITSNEKLIRYYKKKIHTLRKKALDYLTKKDFSTDDMKWINPTLVELYFSYNEKKYYDKAKKYLIIEDET